MTLLMILNHAPYDGTDITWNALRLAKTLIENQQTINLFLMNDSVDLARESCKPPQSYDHDLSLMLKDLIKAGATVKVCGSCMARCGLYKNEPYFAGAERSTMQALSEWVIACDKVLTF